jgi:hypothetical protein
VNRQFAWLSGLALAGCGAIKVQPDLHLPSALVAPLPVDVGVYYPKEYSQFVHTETRWGADWQIALGAPHVKMSEQVFRQAFRKVVKLAALPTEAAPAAVQAVIEPKIEQFSFVTPRDTQGTYYAVTIKYRFGLDSPAGVPIDSYQFTGYGTAPDSGMSAEKPMAAAAAAAMRDAAAKFLVQFPEQAAVKRLVSGEPLVAEVLGQGIAESEEVPMAD